MSNKLTDEIRPLLRNVLTGGGAGSLDGIVTVGLTVPLNGIVCNGGTAYIYQLRAGTDAASSPLIIRPTDFNSGTNAKVWALQSISTFTGAAGGDLSGSYPNPTVAKIGGDALPSNAANGFLKRNAANNAWEEVAYGTGSNNVTAGNDTRLSDTRTPTDATVTDAKIATTLSPSKITGTAVITTDTRLSDARTPTGAAGGDLAGTYANPTVQQASKSFLLTGTATESNDGTFNDYTPSGGTYADSSVIRFVVDFGTAIITGLTGGAAGRIILLVNASTSSSKTITLSKEAAGSTAANRFAFVNDHILGQGDGILLWYDTTSSRWRAVASISLTGDCSGDTGATKVTKASGLFAFTGIISPAQITADQNNYAPTGSTANVVWRINSDAARAITGLASVTANAILVIENVGSFPITLSNQNAASTASNRFDIIADLILPASSSIMLRYDSSASRWRLFNSGLYLRLNGGTITGDVALTARLTLDKYSDNLQSLAYSSTPAFDFASYSSRYMTLTGAITPTTSGRAVGAIFKIYLKADGSGPYAFTWPSWIWTGTAPTTIAASKTGVLTLECVFGTADTDIVASYAVQP